MNSIGQNHSTITTGNVGGGRVQDAQIMRDQRFAALPPSGQKAQGMFVLWVGGVQPGITGEQIDTMLDAPRVQWELQQKPFDPRGFLQAIQLQAPYELRALNQALNDPFEQLMFIGALGL